MPFMAPLGYVFFIFLCSFVVVYVVFLENNARFACFCVSLEKCMLLMVFLSFYSFLGYFSRFSVSLCCFVGTSRAICMGIENSTN